MGHFRDGMGKFLSRWVRVPDMSVMTSVPVPRSMPSVGAHDATASTAPAGTADPRSVFEAALAGADDAIFIAELHGSDLDDATIVFVNEAFVAVTGCSAASAVGRSPVTLLAVSGSRTLSVQTTRTNGRGSGVEQLLRRPDGTPYWAEVAIRPIVTATPPDHVVGTIRDVDDRHHADERLAHAATHDSLTGLPNRAVLLEHLDLAVTRSPGECTVVAVLFVDLDNFKLVNDSLGHDHGDTVLREVARRLRRCLHGDDTVGRFGGDEMVVVHVTTDEASAVALGERILAALAEPMVIADREMVMSASIGLAISGPCVDSSDQLIRNADTALYAAKERGRARLEVFSDELFLRVARRVQTESELRVALREQQLYVEYQPQIDLDTGRLVGVEALVRWQHPERGMVAPDEFITVAEECGLIGALGRYVLETSCRQFVAWRAANRPAPPSLTVNVSLRQLDDPGFVDELATILDDTGIDPASLTLELTESALINSDADVVEVLGRLRALGVYLAIDDFGTEYSSLARLRDLPVEVLKIDRSFVDGLGTEPGDTAIVASIMSLAFAMGLHVIAEGVETESQAVVLAGLGCGVAQGFLFSRSVPAGEIPDLAARRFWKPPLAPISLAAAPAVGVTDAGGRRGRRYFVDEFLDHIGVPMDDHAVVGERTR